MSRDPDASRISAIEGSRKREGCPRAGGHGSTRYIRCPGGASRPIDRRHRRRAPPCRVDEFAAGTCRMLRATAPMTLFDRLVNRQAVAAIPVGVQSVALRDAPSSGSICEAPTVKRLGLVSLVHRSTAIGASPERGRGLTRRTWSSRVGRLRIRRRRHPAAPMKPSLWLRRRNRIPTRPRSQARKGQPRLGAVLGKSRPQS